MKLDPIFSMKRQNSNTAWVSRIFGLGIIITLAIFLLNFYLVGFGVYGDGTGYYAPLRSIIFDGDFKITNEYEFYAQSASKFGGGVRTTYPLPDYSKYTIGMGLILSPFFILGHFLGLILQVLGFNIETNGLSWPYELFYCLGSISLGIAGLILSYQTARRFFSRFASLLAVIGVWFASPLTFYLCLEASMSHAVSQFLISLFLYLNIVTNWLKSPRLQLLMGLVLGLAVLVRPQDGLFLIVPVILGFFQQISSNNVRFQDIQKAFLNPIYLKAGLIIIGTMLLLQLPQIFVYLSQYGSVANIPYLREGADEGYGASFNWGNPQIFKVLFSGFRGLLTWHPILLLGLIGLGFMVRQLPILTSSLWIAFGLQVYLIAAWWCWWQGASFGGRMFSNCSLIFILGLASLWDKFYQKGWSKFAFLLTLFLMFWNGLLVLQYESGLISPEEPISLAQLLKNQFIALPYFINHITHR